MVGQLGVLVAEQPLLDLLVTALMYCLPVDLYYQPYHCYNSTANNDQP